MTMLEGRKLGPADVADVIHGAVDAHLRHGASATGKPGWVMRDRLGGWAAIAGGIFWTGGLFAIMFDPSGRPWNISTSLQLRPWPGVSAVMLMVGSLLLITALVGLSASQGRRHPRLAWAAFVVPALGCVVLLIGMARAWLAVHSPTLAFWEALDVSSTGLLALMVGSILFAVATWRSAEFSRLAALTLLVGASVMVGCVLGGGMPWTRGLMKASWWLGFFYLALIPFAAGWVGLGLSALRGGPHDHFAIEGGPNEAAA